MAGNIFINNDPLLGGRDFTSNIEMMERELAAKQAQLAQ